MDPWRQLVRGLSALLHRHAADKDVADEVEHYLEEATAAWMTRGLSPQDARRAARLEIGSPSVAREQMRSFGWEHTIQTLLADLHYAARQLFRNPGFALVATLTLALGIGASTAIFSAVNPILFEPLPYPHAGRLMMLWGDAQRWLSPTGHVRYFLRAARTEPLFRCRGSDEAVATSDGRKQPAGTIRGSACQRGLLPRVGYIACDRARL